MEMFEGGDLENRVMSKSGCLNYTTTPWEQAVPEVQERRVNYKLSRRISNFGGEVTSTQQKSPLPNDSGWVVNEIMTLHDVPLSDQFRVSSDQLRLKYLLTRVFSTKNSSSFLAQCRSSFDTMLRNLHSQIILANVMFSLG